MAYASRYIRIMSPFLEGIDLKKFLLTLKEEDTTTATYPVAAGKSETPTPTGNWRIIQKTLNSGGPFGVRWMRLSVPCAICSNKNTFWTR